MGKRSFHTDGPINLTKHYGLPQIPRCPDIISLLEKRRLFQVVAPSGYGKTQWLFEIQAEFAKRKDIKLFYVDLSQLDSQGDGQQEIHQVGKLILDTAGVKPFFHKHMIPVEERFATRCRDDMVHIGNTLRKPFSFIFDHVNHLKGATRRYLLRSLRFGHIQSLSYGYALALCFVGNSDLGETADETSPLGYTAIYDEADPAIVVPTFSEAEILALLNQYESERSKTFPSDAPAQILAVSGGVPVKVNRILAHLINTVRKGKRTKAISPEELALALQVASD